MKAFDNQMHILKHTGGKTHERVERLIARLRSELRRRQDVIGEHIVLPYGLHVRRLIVDKCKVMSSAALPLWLAFEGVDPPAGVQSSQAPDFFARLAGRRAALRVFLSCARTPMAIAAGVPDSRRESGRDVFDSQCPLSSHIAHRFPYSLAARTGSPLRSGSVVEREVHARRHHHHADSFSFAAAPGAEGADAGDRSVLVSEWLHKKAPQRASWKKRWCTVEAVSGVRVVQFAHHICIWCFSCPASFLFFFLCLSLLSLGPRCRDAAIHDRPPRSGRSLEGVVRARTGDGTRAGCWR